MVRTTVGARGSAENAGNGKWRNENVAQDCLDGKCVKRKFGK